MVKNLPANAGATGDMGLIPGWGRSPGKGLQDNPLVPNPKWRKARGVLVGGPETGRHPAPGEHKHCLSGRNY